MYVMQQTVCANRVIQLAIPRYVSLSAGNECSALEQDARKWSHAISIKFTVWWRKRHEGSLSREVEVRWRGCCQDITTRYAGRGLAAMRTWRLHCLQMDFAEPRSTAQLTPC